MTFDPSPEMVALVKKVRGSGIKVPLLSNMYLFEIIKTKPSGRYDGFDHTVFSAEAGMTKSNPDIFLRTLEYFGVSPDRALFVDDIAKYTSVAESLGIRSIAANKASFTTGLELSSSILQELGLGRP